MECTCAVVLNWLGLADTLACLAALGAMTPPPQRIMVVDNGSADGSVQALRAVLAGQASAHLVALPHNLGFAAGCNAAITAALAQENVRFFLFVNNDAVLRPGALAAFAADAARRPDIGIFGATVVAAKRPDLLQAAGGCRYHPALTIHRPAHAGLPVSAVPQLPEPRLDYIFGACMLVRREVFDRVGLFDPGYFLYCEELDLCRRARLAGYGLGWTRQAVAVHVGSGSSERGDGTARDRAAFVQYHETASALRCVWRSSAGPSRRRWPFVSGASWRSWPGAANSTWPGRSGPPIGIFYGPRSGSRRLSTRRPDFGSVIVQTSLLG